MLYTETDLEESMDKIETINFHEVKEVAGIKFWCYHAGHVLGAAMFMIEIAGVKVPPALFRFPRPCPLLPPHPPPPPVHFPPALSAPPTPTPGPIRFLPTRNQRRADATRCCWRTFPKTRSVQALEPEIKFSPYFSAEAS